MRYSPIIQYPDDLNKFIRILPIENKKRHYQTEVSNLFLKRMIKLIICSLHL